MKLVRLVALVAFVPVLFGQDVYTTISPGVIRKVQLQPGLNVLADLSGQSTVPIVLIPNALVIWPNAAIGEAAFNKCISGGTAPLPGPLGIGSSCENNRTLEIQKDIEYRTKLAISSLPAQTLANYGMARIE